MRALFNKRGSTGNMKVQRKRIRLTKLIVKEDWRGLIDEIKRVEAAPQDALSPESSDDWLQQALLVVDTENNRSVLHCVCRSHPPIQVVHRIWKACPLSVSHIDNAGQAPLHVAAEWGACPAVIDYLISKYPEAASMADLGGKTPLHLCCENCCFEDAVDSGKPRLDSNEAVLCKGPLLPVVKALSQAAPECCNMEDNEDMNALEYAIMFDADVKVVKALQKASSNAWKEAKKDNFSTLTLAQALPKYESLQSVNVNSTPKSPLRRKSLTAKLPDLLSPGSLLKHVERANIKASSEETVRMPMIARPFTKTEQRRNLKVSKAA